MKLDSSDGRRVCALPASVLGLLLGLGALTLPAPAAATDYYACDCQPGAEALCLAGNDSAQGTSHVTPWRSLSRLQQAVAGSSCGDTFNVCDGGVFGGVPPSQEWTVANQDCSGNPRIVQSYEPGGGYTQRPRLVGDGVFFSLNAPGAKGITIKGIDLICSGTCLTGVGTILANVDNVILDDVVVDGFNVCVQWGTNHVMGVKNSTIQNCKNQGLIGPAGSGSYVIDSRILHNGCHGSDAQSSCAFEHAHYWNVSGTDVSGLVIARNHYENNTLAFGTGACHGNAFAIRGGTGTIVEDNVFITPTSSDPSPFCQVARMATSQPQQGCIDCTFRRNRVLGGAGLFDLQSWIGGYVENNLFYSPTWNQSAAKQAISMTASIGEIDSDGVTIRNNSIVVGNNGTVPAAAITVVAELGTNPHKIVSNSIEMIGTGASDVCFRFISPQIAATVREDYNVCGESNPNAHYASTGSLLTLSQWRANSTGGDHSQEANPGFASAGPPSFDFRIATGSPAIDAGDPVNSAALDIVPATRPVGAAPDAGAFELGGDAPLPAPVLLP